MADEDIKVCPRCNQPWMGAYLLITMPDDAKPGDGLRGHIAFVCPTMGTHTLITEATRNAVGTYAQTMRRLEKIYTEPLPFFPWHRFRPDPNLPLTFPRPSDACDCGAQWTAWGRVQNGSLYVQDALLHVPSAAIVICGRGHQHGHSDLTIRLDYQGELD